MIDDDIDEQPQAENNPTDFNDLHVLQSLNAVQVQVSAAVEACAVPVFPAPLSTADSQNQGQNAEIEQMPDTVKDGLSILGGEKPVAAEGVQGAEIVEFINSKYSLNECLARFNQVAGKTDIWDCDKSEIIKKSGFLAMVGKPLFNKWFDHPDRKVIEKSEIKEIEDNNNAKLADDLVTRYVYLEGTEEVWDLFDGDRKPLKVVKHAHPNLYDLWYKSQQRRMIKSKNLVFDPTSTDPIEGKINTFTGLDISALADESDPSKLMSNADAYKACKPFISLITHLCAGENDGTEDGIKKQRDAASWLLNWMAYPLQHIGAKMATSVLMHGNIHGAGKSLLFGGVLRKIYKQYHTVLDQRDLESQYNDWAEHNLFLLFEEIANNKTKFGMMGFIKHLITGETLSIHKKFLAATQQNNHMNTAFLSNHTQPLPIEENDRRFFVLYPKSKLDPKILDEVLKGIKDETKMRAFYTFLMTRDLSNFGTHTEPPTTQAKQDLIDYSKAGYDTFYAEWRKGETRYPYASCLSTQLYRAFCQWSTFTKEHQVSMKRFIGEGKKYGIETSRDQEHWKGKRKQGQNKVIIIGQQPNNLAKSHWLGLQIEEFEDRLMGVDSNVPEVL